MFKEFHRDKAYFLGGKWTKEKVDKASDETINKLYAEYKQRELNRKSEKNWKGHGQTCHEFVFHRNF